MIYRKLDVNGDMIAGHGLQDFYSDIEAVAQAIKTRLLLLYGEWWEDVDDGLPLFEKIVGYHNIALASVILRERILTTHNVLSVKNINLKLENRKLLFQADVNTIYGEIELNEVIF